MSDKLPQLNDSQTPSATSETTSVEVPASASTETIEALSPTPPPTSSLTPTTATPSTEKLPSRRGRGGTVAATRALSKFEKAAGGRQEIAARIAAGSLSLEQEAFVALLLDPSRDTDSITSLAVDAGIAPDDVLRLYQKGAIAEASAIATSRLAEALPTVTNQVISDAIETRESCPCIHKGKAHPKCQRCMGTGVWVRPAKADQQKMIWEHAGLLKKSGGLTIQQNTAVGVGFGGGFMDKFVRSTDAVAYDVKPSDVIDVEVESETKQGVAGKEPA